MPAKKAPAKKVAPEIPLAAMPHPPVNIWKQNPDHQLRLRQILADPVFLTAMHYAMEETRVTQSDLVGPQPLLAEVIQRKAALHAGGVELLAALKRFASPATTLTHVQEFDHITAEYLNQ